MFRSIRSRIAIPYVVLILMIMLGLGIYLSNLVRQDYLANLEAQLTVAARMISDAVGPELSNYTNSDAVDALAKRYAQLLGMRVTIIAPDGTVLGESDENRVLMDNHLTRPEVAQALAQGVGTSTRLSNTVKYQMMYLAVTEKSGQQVVGIARVALPLKQVETDVRQLQSAVMGATLLAAALAILLATWIAERISHPLRELIEAVEHMTDRGLKEKRIPSHLIPSTSDETGKLTRAINTMASELQSQFDALESERSKLMAVLHEMTDGVIIVDNQGQVQLINPAAENMFGIALTDVQGHTLAEVLRYYQLVELWQSSQDTGKVQNATLEIGDRHLYLQVIATPLGQALPGSILLLFQNLTRLRQVEKLRRDFISNISHELRTPLASLKAVTETLQEGALDDPPAARRFLQSMETEVDALSLMVSELLELSRIESGQVPLKFQALSPIDLMTQAVDRLHLQAERADLSITVDYPTELPSILADPSRLEQALVNLLHNAIKFTSSGGAINVQACLYKNGQDEECILFSVRDTGIGIPAVDLPRIFERFYKVDRARSSGGTGLGLAIARHLVEAHRGKIWAESVEGRGSTFYFTIPLAH